MKYYTKGSYKRLTHSERYSYLSAENRLDFIIDFLENLKEEKLTAEKQLPGIKISLLLSDIGDIDIDELLLNLKEEDIEYTPFSLKYAVTKSISELGKFFIKGYYFDSRYLSDFGVLEKIFEEIMNNQLDKTFIERIKEERTTKKDCYRILRNFIIEYQTIQCI